MKARKVSREGRENLRYVLTMARGVNKGPFHVRVYDTTMEAMLDDLDTLEHAWRTNRKLHRRVQAVEALLLRTIAKAERQAMQERLETDTASNWRVYDDGEE